MHAGGELSQAQVEELVASYTARIADAYPPMADGSVLLVEPFALVWLRLSLAALVLVPGFLNTIQAYRPLETGHALAWVAVPMLGMVWLVAWLAIYTNSRLTLALGLTLVAVASWICSRVSFTVSS